MGKILRVIFRKIFRFPNKKVEEPKITFKPIASSSLPSEPVLECTHTAKSSGSLREFEIFPQEEEESYEAACVGGENWRVQGLIPPCESSRTDIRSTRTAPPAKHIVSRSFVLDSPPRDDEFFSCTNRRLSLSSMDGYSFYELPCAETSHTISSLCQVPTYEVAYYDLVDNDEQQEKLVESFQEIRDSQYAHLENYGKAICDYVGLGLYSFAQLHGGDIPSPKIPPLSRIPCLEFQRLMKEWVFEAFPQEKAFSRNIFRLLQVTDEDYDLYLTPTGGAAIQLLGNSFHFGPQTALLTAYDCFDESVEHVKLMAARAKSRVEECPIQWPSLEVDRPALSKLLRSLNSLREDIGVRPRNSGLFVLPAESRLSGSARGLEMVKEAQSCGWKVLLDATGMSCGQDLVFHGCKPEYVAFSFYKVFGYDPTGFGCLLVRRNPLPTSHIGISSHSSAGQLELPASPSNASEQYRTCSSSFSSKESRDSFSSSLDRSGKRRSSTSSSTNSTPRTSFLSLPTKLAEKYSAKIRQATSPKLIRHRRAISDIFSPSSASSTSPSGSASTTWSGSPGFRPTYSHFSRRAPRLQGRRASLDMPRGPIGADLSSKELESFGFDLRRSLSLAPRSEEKGNYVVVVSSTPQGGQLRRTRSSASAESRTSEAEGGSMNATSSMDEKAEVEVLFLGEFYSMQRLGSPAVKVHLELLIDWLLSALRRLKHPGMQQISVVEIYGPSKAKERGTKIAFNIVDCRWETVPPSLVQMLADRSNLSLCVGKLSKHSRVPPTHALTYRKRFSTTKWRYVECVGASFGLASSFKDVYRVFAFVSKFLDPEFVYHEQKTFELELSQR